MATTNPWTLCVESTDQARLELAGARGGCIDQPASQHSHKAVEPSTLNQRLDVSSCLEACTECSDIQLLQVVEPAKNLYMQAQQSVLQRMFVSDAGTQGQTQMRAKSLSFAPYSNFPFLQNQKITVLRI